MKRYCRPLGLGLTSAFLLLVAVVIYPLIDSITLVLLENEMALKPSTLFYENWVSPRPQVYFQFFIWNLKNPEEFGAQMNGYVRPELEQKGPYSYKEWYTKIDLEQENGAYENSSWAKYVQKRKFEFDAETSCPDCSPEDKVVNINLVAVAVYGIVNNLFHTRPKLGEKRNVMVQKCCQLKRCTICFPDSQNRLCDTNEYGAQCQEEMPFYNQVMLEVNDVMVNADSKLVDDTKTVHEMLFGFYDPIFGAIADRLEDRKILEDKDEIIELLRNLEYGIFKSKNEPSGWGEFKVRNGNGRHCGNGNDPCIERVAEILTWENKTDLSPWYGDDRINYCNRIQGTDGQSTFPGITKDTRIEIFVSDICRNIYMDYEREYTYRGPNGNNSPVPGYMFRTPEDVFASKSQPKNRCYCSPNVPSGWCEELDGFSMIDQCQFGAPVISSAPHFLKASDWFLEVIGGMEPDSVDHVSYIVYEPESGAIITNEKRMQVNFLLTPNDQLDFMTLQKPIPMPMFWLNETMKLDEKTTQELYDNSIKPMKIVKSVQYTLFAVGGALLLACLVDIILLRYCKSYVEVEEIYEKKTEEAKT